MLFHEIYSCYYQAVAKILARAIDGTLTKDSMEAIVEETAFEESFLTILPALQTGQWQLLAPSLKTPLQHCPTLPLTQLEKRWLKAIRLDPRIRLFDPVLSAFPDLEDVEPLFTKDDYVLFDQYNDGDPYEDPHYIAMFRTVREAICKHKKVVVSYVSQRGNRRRYVCDPYKLEYSQKDDKFRVLVAACPYADTLNLKGFEDCVITGDAFLQSRTTKPAPAPAYCVLELVNERNLLERAMLHFSHFQKEAEQIGEDRYRLKLYYDPNDETELVIRVLSMGQFLKATEPAAFVEQIKARLRTQKLYGPR